MTKSFNFFPQGIWAEALRAQGIVGLEEFLGFGG